MSSKTHFLTEDLYHYFLRSTLREPAVLKELREETAALPHAGMQICPEQGQLMALLIRLMGVEKTLEVGVFTGYSSLAVALALPENGKVTACDVSEEWTAIARKYWIKAGVSHKIVLHLAPALETLIKLEATERGTYDFVFIDADKELYEDYFEKSLALVRKGGLIAIDNVFWGGSVIDPTDQDSSTEAVRRFNEARSRDPRIDLMMLPIGDGLTLARKK